MITYSTSPHIVLNNVYKMITYFISPSFIYAYNDEEYTLSVDGYSQAIGQIVTSIFVLTG